MSRRSKRRPVRKTKSERVPALREILMFNTYSSLRDESYNLIVRLVEEALRDRELREKIDYHGRQIMKEIAARL